MNVNEVHSVVKQALASVRFKYLGNIRNGRQVWASDEEDEPTVAIEAVLGDLDYAFGAVTKYNVRRFNTEKGTLEVDVGDVLLEITYGTMGDGATAGCCLFISYMK